MKAASSRFRYFFLTLLVLCNLPLSGVAFSASNGPDGRITNLPITPKVAAGLNHRDDYGSSLTQAGGFSSQEGELVVPYIPPADLKREMLTSKRGGYTLSIFPATQTVQAGG